MGLRDLFRRQEATAADLDNAVLARLRGIGADLSRPRHAIQFLYFAGEAGARGAAETLGASGYDVEVRAPAEGIEQWGVVAETHAVVDEAWVREMRPRLEAIAHANGGEYDGWEAAAD